MQEDAENMNYVEFISEYGVANIDIWRDYHDPNYENTNVDEYMSEGCPWTNPWSLLRGSMPKTDKPVGTLSKTYKKNA